MTEMKDLKEVRETKSIILLATALFLIGAPTPDSWEVAEITSNFIVPDQLPGLMTEYLESE